MQIQKVLLTLYNKNEEMNKIKDFFYLSSLWKIFISVTLFCWILFIIAYPASFWEIPSVNTLIATLFLSLPFGFSAVLYSNIYKKSRSFWEYAKQVRKSISDAIMYSQIEIVKLHFKGLEKLIDLPRHRREFEAIKMETELKRRKILKKLKKQK